MQPSHEPHQKFVVRDCHGGLAVDGEIIVFDFFYLKIREQPGTTIRRIVL